MAQKSSQKKWAEGAVIPRDVFVNEDYIRSNFEQFQVDEWHLLKISWEEEQAIDNLLADVERSTLERLRQRERNVKFRRRTPIDSAS